MIASQWLSANSGQAVACWLLHGFLGSSRNMLSYGKALAQQCPQVGIAVLDLPGHGQSSPIQIDATLDSMAQDVWAKLHATAPQAQHVLIGHSFGGRVAMRLQYHYQQSIKGLLLLDIGPSPMLQMDHTMELVVQQLLAAPSVTSSRAAMRQCLLHPNLPTPLIDWVLLNGKTLADGQFAWQIDRATLCAVQQRERLRDLWPDGQGFAASWTCVVGGNSNFVAPATQTMLRSHGIQVHTLANVGHNVHSEALAALLPLTVDWLAQVRLP